MQLYLDKNYAAERLNGTIVRWRGKAVRVIGIAAISAVQILRTGENDAAPYNELDLNPVPLGYCNFNGTALYLSRSPVREDWKQGLRVGTMRATFSDGKVVKPLREDLDRFRDADEDENGPIRLKNIPDVEVAKTIEGEYPSLDDILTSLRRGGKKLTQLAYNRNFAVDINFNIFHKGEYLIGKFTSPETHAYQLDDKFWWAKEALEESF